MQSFAASGYLAWEMGGGSSCCHQKKGDDEESAATTSGIEVFVVDESRGRSMGRLLIFVNPHSGPGLSEQVFRRQLQPLLKGNRISYELIITKGANHARAIVEKREDLDTFNAIFIFSGDGLIFEVLNGILSRSDRDRFLPHLPLGIVPSGSGNGLLASVLVAEGRPVLPAAAFLAEALALTSSPRSQARPVSLMHIQTPDSNFAGFLSIGWGLMADIDIESERWRKSLGPRRFILGALVRCLKLRTYRGRLSFLRYDPASIVTPASSVSSLCRSERDAVIHEVYKSTPRDLFGDVTISAKNEDDEEIRGRRHDDVFSSRHAVQVPKLEEEVPSSWTTIEDEFINVYALSRSHISNEGHFMPDASLNDDVIHLTYILKKDVRSRTSLMSMLDAMQKGDHLKKPFVKLEHVSAFRLERLSEGSFLTVDGEVVDALKAQVTASSFRMGVISRTG